MSDSATDTGPPPLRLATEIADRLVEAGLLRPARRDWLIDRIATGAMKADDWKVETELAVAKATAADCAES